MGFPKDGGERIRFWHTAVIEAVFTLVGLFSLGIGAKALWDGVAAMAATAIAIGVVLLFASNLQRFELLKGFGIEAKMRTLDEKIDEATVTIKQFRALTEATAKAIVMMQSKLGRWNSAPTFDDSYAAIQQVQNVLELSKFAPHEVRSTLQPWVRTVATDMANSALEDFHQACQQIASDLNAEIQSLSQPFTPADLPTYNALLARRNAIQEHSVRYRRIFPELDISEFSSRLRTAITDCSEIPTSRKNELLVALVPYVVAIDNLRENLEINDHAFWRKHTFN